MLSSFLPCILLWFEYLCVSSTNSTLGLESRALLNEISTFIKQKDPWNGASLKWHINTMTLYYVNFFLLLPKKSSLSKVTLPSGRMSLLKKRFLPETGRHTLPPSLGCFCFVTCSTFGLTKPWPCASSEIRLFTQEAPLTYRQCTQGRPTRFQDCPRGTNRAPQTELGGRILEKN